MQRLTVGSLFSGIGGLDLGLERAGMVIRWQCELDPFCRKVLDKHWPGVPRYADIRELRGEDVETVDLLCGGFPCQPHSVAGKRLASADERDLWGEFARVIREVKPRWVLAENVPGLLSSENGRFFGRVLRDLAACGYRVEWDCIPAAAVGAPHLRDRVWIVAYSNCGRQQGKGLSVQRSQPGQEGDFLDLSRRSENVANPNGHRCWRGESQPEPEPRSCGAANFGEVGQNVANAESHRWDCAPQPPLDDEARCRESRCGPDHGRQDVANACCSGLPQSQQKWTFCGPITQCDWWATEPDVGRVAHGVRHRVDRLRALGNAVVPQVAEWIGRRIVEAERRERVA